MVEILLKGCFPRGCRSPQLSLELRPRRKQRRWRRRCRSDDDSVEHGSGERNAHEPASAAACAALTIGKGPLLPLWSTSPTTCLGPGRESGGAAGKSSAASYEVRPLDCLSIPRRKSIHPNHIDPGRTSPGVVRRDPHKTGANPARVSGPDGQRDVARPPERDHLRRSTNRANKMREPRRTNSPPKRLNKRHMRHATRVRRYRTQEVAGSSPASSTNEFPAKEEALGRSGGWLESFHQRSTGGARRA